MSIILADVSRNRCDQQKVRFMGSKGYVRGLWLVDFDPFICQHKNIQRQDLRISIRKVYRSSENWWPMASIYRRLCRITSRIKGDHCYRSNPRINEVCNCIPEPSNAYSHNAMVVKMKNTNGGEQDATTVGQVPDSLAEVRRTRFNDSFHRKFDIQICFAWLHVCLNPQDIWKVQKGSNLQKKSSGNWKSGEISDKFLLNSANFRFCRAIGALFRKGFPLEFAILTYFPFVGPLSRRRVKLRRAHYNSSSSTTVSLTLKHAHTSSWSSSETLNQREDDLRLHT